MLSYIRTKRDEEGFTLIELLVVVLIIGILAAIAIPVFLNQRENAWRSAVESDLRNAAIQIETVMTREGVYPDDITTAVAGPATAPLNVAATATGIVLTVSENISLTYAETGSAFTITATHGLLDAAEDTLIYDSSAGGLATATWG